VRAKQSPPNLLSLRHRPCAAGGSTARTPCRSPILEKKRGGQLGNSDSLKRGFYARAFTPSEKNLLKADSLYQLRGEEALLHVLVLRGWRSLRSVLPDGITSQEFHFTLRCITYATFVIEKLQRVRRRLFGDSTELEKDIQQGLDEACKDLGINCSGPLKLDSFLAILRGWPEPDEPAARRSRTQVVSDTPGTNGCVSSCTHLRGNVQSGNGRRQSHYTRIDLPPLL